GRPRGARNIAERIRTRGSGLRSRGCVHIRSCGRRRPAEVNRESSMRNPAASDIESFLQRRPRCETRRDALQKAGPAARPYTLLRESAKRRLRPAPAQPFVPLHRSPGAQPTPAANQPQFSPSIDLAECDKLILLYGGRWGMVPPSTGKQHTAPLGRRAGWVMRCYKHTAPLGRRAGWVMRCYKHTARLGRGRLGARGYKHTAPLGPGRLGGARLQTYGPAGAGWARI